MKKMTLLEMVQNILSALDSDEVNSISDTTESLQVAEIIKETFYSEFNNTLVPEQNKIIQLEGLGLVASPNYLKIPDNVDEIHWIKYRILEDAAAYRDVEFIHQEDFLDIVLNLQSGTNTTLTTDPTSGFSYYVRNDVNPSFYTIFDDKYLAFDSFNSAYEATLQQASNLSFGRLDFNFPYDDDFVPPIDGNLFPLLLAEAKSIAFTNLKQMPNGKEEQRARRQRIKLQNDKFRSERADRDYRSYGPNFAFPR